MVKRATTAESEFCESCGDEGLGRRSLLLQPDCRDWDDINDHLPLLPAPVHDVMDEKGRYCWLILKANGKKKIIVSSNSTGDVIDAAKRFPKVSLSRIAEISRSSIGCREVRKEGMTRLPILLLPALREESRSQVGRCKDSRLLTTTT